LLAIGDVGLVAGGIDEGVLVAGLEARVLGLQVEIAAVRAEEDIAGQGFFSTAKPCL
jgi:hypothetical protein